MVYITKYVDDEWMLGEVETRRGLLPISYVNVIVDLVVGDAPVPDSSAQSGSDDFKTSAVTVHENLVVDTFHKVLYTFQVGYAL